MRRDALLSSVAVMAFIFVLASPVLGQEECLQKTDEKNNSGHPLECNLNFTVLCTSDTTANVSWGTGREGSTCSALDWGYDCYNAAFQRSSRKFSDGHSLSGGPIPVSFPSGVSCVFFACVQDNDYEYHPLFPATGTVTCGEASTPSAIPTRIPTLMVTITSTSNPPSPLMTATSTESSAQHTTHTTQFHTASNTIPSTGLVVFRSTTLSTSVLLFPSSMSGSRGQSDQSTVPISVGVVSALGISVVVGAVVLCVARMKINKDRKDRDEFAQHKELFDIIILSESSLSSCGSIVTITQPLDSTASPIANKKSLTATSDLSSAIYDPKKDSGTRPTRAVTPGYVCSKSHPTLHELDSEYTGSESHPSLHEHDSEYIRSGSHHTLNETDSEYIHSDMHQTIHELYPENIWSDTHCFQHDTDRSRPPDDVIMDTDSPFVVTDAGIGLGTATDIADAYCITADIKTVADTHLPQVNTQDYDLSPSLSIWTLSEL